MYLAGLVWRTLAFGVVFLCSLAGLVLRCFGLLVWCLCVCLAGWFGFGVFLVYGAFMCVWLVWFWGGFGVWCFYVWLICFWGGLGFFGNVVIVVICLKIARGKKRTSSPDLTRKSDEKAFS